MGEGAGKVGVHAGARYGILGGTFDPPHVGHLVLAQEAYTQLGLDRVWFVPTREPPHKHGRAITPSVDRLAMTEAAVAGDERFAVSTIELDRPGPSYTAETLVRMRDMWGPDVYLALIMGWDMLVTLPSWHDAAAVVERADVVAASHRPGVPVSEEVLASVERALPGLRAKVRFLPAPQLDLAATTIRERVASGLPIRYLVPDSVRSYIERRSLYREQPSPEA